MNALFFQNSESSKSLLFRSRNDATYFFSFRVKNLYCYDVTDDVTFWKICLFISHFIVSLLTCNANEKAISKLL